MTISGSQFAAWLEDSTAQRVVLFEVNVSVAGVDQVRYLSTKAYGRGSSATPYLAIVAGGLKMTELISLVSEAGLSAGDIEIYNFNGEFDTWIDDLWVNKRIQAWVGDVRWDRADFQPIFDGLVADIDATKSRDRLNLKLRDKLQRLNTPVSEDLMGGVSPTPGALRGRLLGEAHNLTPKLKNAATGEFEFNGAASEDVIEVRTDGKKRTTVTKNLAAGSFTFTDAVGPGAVTCSAQGVKLAGVYVNTVAKLIEYLVTQCGKVSDRFTAADLDLVNFAAFNSAHAQAVGLWLPERMNVLDACHQLASSIGAQIVPSRDGLLRLIQIAFPVSAATELRANVQLDRSIQLVEQTEVVGAVKINYCKNWTVQANLQSGLPSDHKELFATEWLTASATDGAVMAAYKLDGAPGQIDTCLLTAADAQAEADRRLAIFKVKRKTYRFEGTPGNLLLTLGQDVKLFSKRYGLQAGKFGIVTKLEPDWENFHVTVEVTI